MFRSDHEKNVPEFVEPSKTTCLRVLQLYVCVSRIASRRSHQDALAPKKPLMSFVPSAAAAAAARRIRARRSLVTTLVGPYRANDVEAFLGGAASASNCSLRQASRCDVGKGCAGPRVSEVLSAAACPLRLAAL